MRTQLFVVLSVLATACGGDSRDRVPDTGVDTTANDTTPNDTTAPDDTGVADSETTAPNDTGVAATDTTAPNDTGVAATDTTTPNDTGVAETETPDTSDPLYPNISVALDCGDGPGGGAGAGNRLARHEIDTNLFPDALCNNGDAAVFYYRPYVGEENKDRWLINLNGGGSCSGGGACAARWCWCQSTDGPNGCPFANTTTNFSMENMNADTRATIEDSGINLRGDAARVNFMGNWNHVRVVYCSSDTWSGTRRDVPFDTVHPKTGVPVKYSIHFLGSRILDATLATLRRDGVAPLRFTLGNERVMPDIDDAVEVVLSGDSGGGAGVINNLDRVQETLRASNTKCAGGTCPLVVQGLMDAIVGPELARLDFSTTIFAESGVDTYEEAVAYVASVGDVNSGARGDESCRGWHEANAPGSEGMCADQSHILRHHVTTPFFVRMALLDSLISGNYIDTGYTDPDLGKFTLEVFARVLQRELKAFPDLAESAHEGDAMMMAPGVFAPACSKHDTIHSNADVYRTTITMDEQTYVLLDVFRNWREGLAPSAVLTQDPQRTDTFCPPQ